MSNTSYRHLIDTSEFLVFVGRGGVGKTSCAAATALEAARLGRKVAILTIDPAPRLGDALGLDCLDATPRRIALGHDTLAGTLDAMRLDTKGTFDRVVERFAPSRETARALLDNPLYQTIAGSLGGSESYMALQRLYELFHEGSYELLVVDTPPATHAAELLSAPPRLAALMETGALSVLADPARILVRTGSRVAGAGAALLLGLLGRITGSALREQVTTFVAGFESVLSGIADRAHEVEHLLARPETAFIHIVRPDIAAVDNARILERTLAEARLSVRHRIVNRLTPPRGTERGHGVAERVREAPYGTAEAVAAMERALDYTREAEQDALAALALAVDAEEARTPTSLLQSLDHDIARTSDLAALGRALSGERG